MEATMMDQTLCSTRKTNAPAITNESNILFNHEKSCTHKLEKALGGLNFLHIKRKTQQFYLKFLRKTIKKQLNQSRGAINEKAEIISNSCINNKENAQL